jgi:hypothetical protein
MHPELKTQALELHENTLVRGLQFRVEDINLFNEEQFTYAMRFSLESSVALPKDERFRYLSESIQRMFSTAHAAQPTYLFGQLEIDVKFDSWERLVKQGDNLGLIFSQTFEYFETLRNHVNQLGFLPVPCLRRMQDLESEADFKIRTQARDELLKPLQKYLALPDPLASENTSQLSEFYKMVEELYKLWERTSLKKSTWTTNWLQSVYISSHRAGIIKRVSVDGTKDSPYKKLAEQAQAGESVSEWDAVQFLNALLEWIGPGDNLANADLNVTIPQVQTQLKSTLKIPRKGSVCDICGTINPDPRITCYWCHTSIKP